MSFTCGYLVALRNEVSLRLAVARSIYMRIFDVTANWDNVITVYGY